MFNKEFVFTKVQEGHLGKSGYFESLEGGHRLLGCYTQQLGSAWKGMK